MPKKINLEDLRKSNPEEKSGHLNIPKDSSSQEASSEVHFVCSNNTLHIIDSKVAENNNYFCPKCDYGFGILQRLNKKKPESVSEDDNKQVPNLKGRKRIPVEKKTYKEIEDKTDKIAYVNFLIKETERVNAAIEKVPLILDNLKKKGWDELDLEKYFATFETICQLEFKQLLEYELANLNIEIVDFIKVNDLLENFSINEEALIIHKAIISNAERFYSGGWLKKELESIGIVYRSEFLKLMNSLYIPKYFGMYNYTLRGGSGWFFSDSFVGRYPSANY